MVQVVHPASWSAASEAASFVWEESSCPLCAHEHARPILEASDPDRRSGGLRFAIVRCQRCGLLFTNPRPDAVSIGRFYSPDYPAHRKPKLLQHLARRWYPFARLLGRPCPERRVLPWHGRGRLLDFGCGGGKFLLRMQDQGWKVVGIDRCPTIVQVAREKLGVKALLGTLPHAEIAPDSFDVVTMWSTLAHVHQPLQVLRETFRILAPGGRLYVEVPNIESWGFRWFGSRWTGLDLPRHLTHFSPLTLRTMLETAGFQIRSSRMATHADWLRSSARAARRDRGSSVLLQLLRVKPLANIISWLGYISGHADSIMSIAERPA